MLPHSQQLLFLLFAATALALGARGFYRLYLRIARGRADAEPRLDHLPRRIAYALTTTLTQSRTFRKRPWVSFFHSFIFYGFTFYLLVNLVDAVEGFHSLDLEALGPLAHAYIFCADILSFLVLLGVVALVLRRFLLPSRRDFTFNPRTLLHPALKRRYVTRDSIIVSAFILFHVGSRAVGAGAAIAALSTQSTATYAPFATLLSHLFTPENAFAWRIFGYWGALGSVLAFLAYFPYSKHIHIFLAPAKYLIKRDLPSGVLPGLDLEAAAASDSPALGAAKLEDLAWPRLLDAYACIQCNRCQDVCPATQTGKSLSPSALEINKRMELNNLASDRPAFEAGAESPNPLLSFALSAEAAWACTTCGACIDVCPVGDEPMLDIVDIRRHQIMVEGEFPAQLQSAFRGMERAQNPWGINAEKRLDWAAGLNVPTTDQKPAPDVLYWVGCAPSYDPQSQKTARAFVQLLDHAGVDFAVLGKKECCTGDPARRAGNEYLYRQLADRNVATLDALPPSTTIVTTCPHCLNAVGKEYSQLGGSYKVLHHTEYLDTLVTAGKLKPQPASSPIAFHDPCYLGRHNGIYDAPRNLLNVLSNDVRELPRNRENSFCCGAGGAQFWKEEEPGNERISDSRYREAGETLALGALGSSSDASPVLAVGCPFCKSMLESTPSKGELSMQVRDVAELLLDSLQLPAPTPAHSSNGAIREEPAVSSSAAPASQPSNSATLHEVALPPQLKNLQVTELDSRIEAHDAIPNAPATPPATAPTTEQVASLPELPRRKWAPKVAGAVSAVNTESSPQPAAGPVSAAAPVRKAWVPRPTVSSDPLTTGVSQTAGAELSGDTSPKAPPLPDPPTEPAPQRRKWSPKAAAQSVETVADAVPPADSPPSQGAAIQPARKKWTPKASTPASDSTPDRD